MSEAKVALVPGDLGQLLLTLRFELPFRLSELGSRHLEPRPVFYLKRLGRGGIEPDKHFAALHGCALGNQIRDTVFSLG